jgi:ankyrin repeat protein
VYNQNLRWFLQNGYTALMKAVEYCHTAAVLALIKAEADLDLQNKVRRIALLSDPSISPSTVECVPAIEQTESVLDGWNLCAAVLV